MLNDGSPTFTMTRRQYRLRSRISGNTRRPKASWLSIQDRHAYYNDLWETEVWEAVRAGVFNLAEASQDALDLVNNQVMPAAPKPEPEASIEHEKTGMTLQQTSSGWIVTGNTSDNSPLLARLAKQHNGNYARLSKHWWFPTAPEELREYVDEVIENGT